MATKDYQGHGRCVRLFAISPEEFSEEFLADGVTTYTIDIDYWYFCAHELGLKSWKSLDKNRCGAIDRRDDELEYRASWYRIELALDEGRDGYIYPTFSEDGPRFFGIAALERLHSGPLIPLPPFLHPSLQNPPSGLNFFSLSSDGNQGTVLASSANQFVFDSFHVGQGMCSLVHNGQVGLLIDAGAGKPITRRKYLSGKIKNQLEKKVSALQEIQAVISHADSDHWRMLSWDSSLRSKVSRIHVPIGAKSLAFKDKATINKIVAIGDQTWGLDQTSSLQLLRSKPSMSDSNGECLVVVFNRLDRRVLAPGDYVYHRFLTDGNPGIAALPGSSFSGVVVPHHGDAASSKSIVTAHPGAKAFFSAGTHQGYGHPTDLSVQAHQRANYKTISSPKLSNIVARRLL